MITNIPSLTPTFIEYPCIVQEHPLNTYAQSMTEREVFLEIAKKIAKLLATHFQQNNISKIFAELSRVHAPNEQVARQEITWEQQDAFAFNKEYPSEASVQGTRYPLYITPNAILLVGPLIGIGVTPEVHMGAEILADEIRIFAMNFLRTTDALYSYNTAQKNL